MKPDLFEIWTKRQFRAIAKSMNVLLWEEKEIVCRLSSTFIQVLFSSFTLCMFKQQKEIYLTSLNKLIVSSPVENRKALTVVA